MGKQQRKLRYFVLLFAIALSGCQTSDSLTSEPQSSEAEVSASGTGTLQLRANGEDFIRQGFVSKDGWQIEFDHAYVNLVEAKAYQTEPPFNPEAGDSLQASQTVELIDAKTVDLAAGDENAETILVSEIVVPAGHYNALSWKMTPAESGVISGQVIVLQGTAIKDNQTIPFTLNIDQPLEFTCGDFVGDARKGILQPDETTDIEATFHFDHLFGDGEAEPTDEINTGALGFEPIATLAENGTVEADWQTLTTQLSAEEVEKLNEILPSLGHVGEGHCEESQLGVAQN
ncbi:MAG: DUF4382 domain-containing protein [Microcoleaceae cyanobacterium]